MNIKGIKAWLLIALIIASVFGFKAWQTSQTGSSQLLTLAGGPAVILFRGDNSPSCQAIHHLVDQAAHRYQGRISVVQTDWSTDNPLINKYRIRFLPAVVFVDSNGNEVERIIGESLAVQEKLGRALTQLDDLLRQ